MKKVVVIGGGTGTFTVLSGLRNYPFELTAIVSTADDGGSTGILRDEMGVLPPGDIRQALVALANDSGVVRELFNYRFSDGPFKGHSFGNIFLSAMEKVTGSFDTAVMEAGRVLAIKGSVIPVTNDTVYLRAQTCQGRTIKGEHRIEEHIWSEISTIKRLWLEPECQIHPQAKKAILQADLVVIAPGSLFTSLIPNLLVTGMREALHKTRAQIIYISNLMTEKGQADSFFVQDFVDTIESYLGKNEIDFVIYNTRQPNKELLDHYKKEMERTPVRLDRKRLSGVHYRRIGVNLLSHQVQKPKVGDVLAKERTLIRHDSKKLAEVIYALAVFKDAKKYLK